MTPSFSLACRTHDLEALMKLADLEKLFGPARGANPNLNAFWGVTTAWTEETRYQKKGQADAEQLYEAIINDPDGVMKWIKTHW
jgi:hypothetical protein